MNRVDELFIVNCKFKFNLESESKDIRLRNGQMPARLYSQLVRCQYETREGEREEKSEKNKKKTQEKTEKCRTIVWESLNVYLPSQHWSMAEKKIICQYL